MHTENDVSVLLSTPASLSICIRMMLSVEQTNLVTMAFYIDKADIGNTRNLL